MSKNPSNAPDADWQEIAAALAAGEVVGAEGGAVFETHISYVVVGQQCVYKLKKPVALSFVDYSTPARRREMCERERDLNRPLAPRLYRGVGGIRRGHAGLELCEASDPQAIEFVVLMDKVEVSQTLESRVDGLLAQPADLEAVGRVLARFHADAPVAPEPAGSPERWQQWAAQLTAGLRRAPDEVLSAERIEAACGFLERWIAVSKPRLLQRRREGHIREGHGDLRLNHVVFAHDSVEVLDCVEFDDALRRNDVLADLSFLAMELQYADREDLTRALLKAWELEGGPLEQDLLWAYATSRALIRVGVGLARADQLRSHGPSLELRLAQEGTQTLLDLALRLSWRARTPRVIVFAGLSGSGKSSISRALAERWGLERVSSDETRKRLVGVARNDLAPPHAYEDYVSNAVYERMGREAGRELAAGRSLVVDGTFRRPSDAQAFVRALRSAGGLSAPLTLACSAPNSTLRTRVEKRAERGGSDAGTEVLDAQLAEHGDMAVGISDAVTLNTDGSLASAVQTAERIVLDETVTTHDA